MIKKLLLSCFFSFQEYPSVSAEGGELMSGQKMVNELQHMN